MKIIRKAIYPSPCSLPFLPFLLSFPRVESARLSYSYSSFLSLSLSPFLPRSFSLITLYIHWMRIVFSALKWTICPGRDGNRGTFIRRSNRSDSNSLLISMILIITLYSRPRHLPAAARCTIHRLKFKMSYYFMNFRQFSTKLQRHNIFCVLFRRKLLGHLTLTLCCTIFLLNVFCWILIYGSSSSC